MSLLDRIIIKDILTSFNVFCILSLLFFIIPFYIFHTSIILKTYLTMSQQLNIPKTKQDHTPLVDYQDESDNGSNFED